MNISDEGKGEGKSYIFRLFVAGDEPHSRKAKDNLRKFCASHTNESFDIEVVDVTKSFQLALENKIFLTPALVLVSSERRVTVYGDLSDTRELIDVLGLRGDE